MYISKALQNIRQRPNGRNPSLSSDQLWSPATVGADATQANQFPAGPERTCGIMFSSGGVLTDDNWIALQALSLTLNTMRSWIISNRNDITLQSTFASVGNGRILFHEGYRSLQSVDNSLGYFTYASPFTRMYIALSAVAGSMAVTTAITSLIELTPDDLKTMGADITIDSQGVGTLNSPVILNSILLR